MGRRGGRNKPGIVQTTEIHPSCSSSSGNLTCRYSFIPNAGTKSTLYRASRGSKHYKIKITARERGDRVIAAGFSDLFALLDTANSMDIHVKGLRVTEAGHLEVKYSMDCPETFSARVPFKVEWPHQPGGDAEVTVTVNSGDDDVWADLGRVRDLKPRGTDLKELTCRVTANQNREFYENDYDNNQYEKRIPLVAKYVIINFIGSDVSGNTFYYHDYQRFHCCECEAGFRITNRGYQTVTGEIEIHQTGNWDTGGGSGTLSPPYHDNHLVTWDYTITPGDRVNSPQIVQRSLLPGLRWTPSNLVFTFHGDFADFISPNPATKALRHRDGT
jgi:hypothetical protein